MGPSVLPASGGQQVVDVKFKREQVRGALAGLFERVTSYQVGVTSRKKVQR
jgi:hypothetical protein